MLPRWNAWAIVLLERAQFASTHMSKCECFMYFLLSLCMTFILIWFAVFSEILQQEFANRLSILSSDYLQQLVKLLHTYSLAKKSALQVQNTLILVLSIIWIIVNYISFLWACSWNHLSEPSSVILVVGISSRCFYGDWKRITFLACCFFLKNLGFSSSFDIFAEEQLFVKLCPDLYTDFCAPLCFRLWAFWTSLLWLSFQSPLKMKPVESGSRWLTEMVNSFVNYCFVAATLLIQILYSLDWFPSVLRSDD